MGADKKAAARELIRRMRCQQSLHSFALNINIPLAPTLALHPDEDLLGPARSLMAAHHALFLDVMQRTMNRPFGRCIIQAPPGSAKSSYAKVACAWEMSRKPGSRLIYTSYGSDLAETASGHIQMITQQEEYAALWGTSCALGDQGVKKWNLRNGHRGAIGSELIAAGLTAGITGNRATGWIIDDPVKGREDADSEAFQKKTVNSYMSDLRTRVLPEAWGVLILTRWSENDLAGFILPSDYDGGSGTYIGHDGLEWEVLAIPAKCERADDPLGRKPGEYLWTEYFPPKHWQMFENATGNEAARDWASLYQQRPTPQGSGRLDENAIDYYKPGAHPPVMGYVGAGDYAVTEGKNDFTELGVFGVDTKGELWEVDWWNAQCDTGKSTEQSLDMIARWKIPMWFNEGGVIDKSMGPLFNLRMRERGKDDPRVWADRRALPSMHDKLAKCQGFIARCNAGAVHFRDNANSRRIVSQIAALPAGRYDDAADVCGLIGRALDQFPVVRETKPPPPAPTLKPFTKEWLHYKPESRTRLRLY